MYGWKIELQRWESTEIDFASQVESSPPPLLSRFILRLSEANVIAHRINWKIIPARFSVTISIQVTWNYVIYRRYQKRWEWNNNQELIIKRYRKNCQVPYSSILISIRFSSCQKNKPSSFLINFKPDYYFSKKSYEYKLKEAKLLNHINVYRDHSFFFQYFPWKIFSVWLSILLSQALWILKHFPWSPYQVSVDQRITLWKGRERMVLVRFGNICLQSYDVTRANYGRFNISLVGVPWTCELVSPVRTVFEH